MQQLCAVRDQLASETAKHKEFHDAITHKLKAEESHRANAEDHLAKAQHEVNHFKAEHFTVGLVCFNFLNNIHLTTSC